MSDVRVEAVLGVLPEQLWSFDEELPSGVTTSSTVDMAVTVPMKVRREIVACVLAVTGAME